ncbi:MAG: response regulator transcription factor [Dehalococcoidia bacterium]|nr:response regulator transcription factor [Dehalococcoidia bacterium]
MIRVLIADDHPVVREGLKRILGEQSDIAIVGEAATGDEVLGALRTTKPDVLLLDIGMPGTRFVDVLKQLKADHPRVAVLVLSVYPEDQFALRAFRAGARGYLTKDHAPRQLVTAIRHVHSGGRFITPTAAEGLLVELERGPDTVAHDLLSEQEHAVLRGLVAGKSVKTIGADMDLSPKTISTYRSRILKKLGLESNADLVRYAIQHGLAE